MPRVCPRVPVFLFVMGLAATVLGQPTATPASPAAGVVSADIAALREQAVASDQLTEEQRTEIIELLDLAVQRREKTQALWADLQELLKEAQSAGEPVPSPSTPKPPSPEQLDMLSPDELRAEVAAAEQQVSEARAKVDRITAEIDRRAQRRQEIPEVLSTARDFLQQAEAALATETPDDSPLMSSVLRLYQQTHRDRWQAGVQSIEQESRTYEATARRQVALRDVAISWLQAAQERQEVISEVAARAEKAVADRKAIEARQAALNAHPAVKEAADRNAELAEQNREMVARIAGIEHQIADAKKQAEEMNKRLKIVRQRVKSVDDSPVIGEMLLSQQDQLPNVAPLKLRVSQRLEKKSELRLDRYDWEIEREGLLPVEQTVERTVAGYEAQTGAPLSQEIVAELQKALNARAELLLELTTHAEDLETKLAELSTADSDVLTTTQELSSFIQARVFWVPSAPPLSLREQRYVGDFWSKLDQRLADFKGMIDALLSDARRRPGLWLLGALTVLLLIAVRRRAKRWLYALGEEASRPFATLYSPTPKAALATLIVAAPISVLIGFAGWRLMAQTFGFPYATGVGLMFFAQAYLAHNLVRLACRPGGLATQHFDWDPKVANSIRRAARASQLFALPLLAIVVGVEASRDDAAIDAIGRVTLLMALAAFGAIGATMLRPGGPVADAIAGALGANWGSRLSKLAAPLFVLGVLWLIWASVTGLNYTAMQLTWRALFTAGLIAACLVARELLQRWLLVAYRRVAMQRAQEKRQAMQEAKESLAPEAAAVDSEPEVKLSDINQQAHSLVNTGVIAALLCALLVVWGDVLPALGYLDSWNLWQGTYDAPEGGAAWVTLADLLLAIAAFALTWFGGRNLPSLLEFSLFQKLPMDAGARYAASTVTRYLITVIGFLMGMRLLGVGWNSVQWLVAAMGVGLGFGLQEIFANFVSGIIMLFERPVRPGDVVTIGDVSGCVTKIRIRATTIQDWDNKELIVPNRDFITGNLINWTLSSRMLRAVIKVGVAYGSDTRLVIRLLYEIAGRDERVMKEPAPMVVFDNFGDSTLNFELRCFVNDIANLLFLKHDLHLAVDDAFREHGIEIAFPQRDLHLRSVPESMARQLAMNGDGHNGNGHNGNGHNGGVAIGEAQSAEAWMLREAGS